MLLKLFGQRADPEKHPLPAADEALLARLDKINSYIPKAQKIRDGNKAAERFLTLDYCYKDSGLKSVREHLKDIDKKSYYTFVAQSAATSGDIESRLNVLDIEMKALSKLSTPKIIFMMRLDAAETFIDSIENPSLGKRILDKLQL